MKGEEGHRDTVTLTERPGSRLAGPAAPRSMPHSQSAARLALAERNSRARGVR